MASEGNHETRISSVQTSWALILRAHGSDSSAAQKARHELLERYAPAVRRYLQALTKDVDRAEELYQEFAVRILQGELHRADQQLGQFRKYLKTVLFNLVRKDYRASQRKQTANLESDIAENADQESLFREAWRAEILSNAWQELSAFEQSTGRPFFRLLKYRADHPQAKSSELAAFVSENIGTNCSETAVRKMLQRARTQFAKHLSRAVRDTLADPSQQELGDELRELGLLKYCEPVLESN